MLYKFVLTFISVTLWSFNTVVASQMSCYLPSSSDIQPSIPGSCLTQSQTQTQPPIVDDLDSLKHKPFIIESSQTSEVGEVNINSTPAAASKK